MKKRTASSRIASALLIVGFVIEKVTDWIARIGGIYADTPAALTGIKEEANKLNSLQWQGVQIALVLIVAILIWLSPYLFSGKGESSDIAEDIADHPESNAKEIRKSLSKMADSITDNKFNAGIKSGLRSGIRGLVGELAIHELDACVSDSHWESQAYQTFISGLSKRIDKPLLQKYQENSTTAIRMSNSKKEIAYMIDKIPVPMKVDSMLKGLIETANMSNNLVRGIKETDWKCETKASVRAVFNESIVKAYDGIVTRNNSELSAISYLNGLAQNLKITDLRT